MKNTFIQHKGFRVYKDDISILMQSSVVMKEGFFSNTEQKINLAKAFQTFLDSRGNRPVRDYTNCSILQHDSFIEDTADIPFYKYVSKNTLNNFILKGRFRLGSLLYYQCTLNKNIQDYLEGFTHLFLNYKNRQHQRAFYSGFNYLIFCGSHVPPNAPEAQFLLKNFGECVIKIKHPQSFKRAIIKEINAYSCHQYKVKYEPLKIMEISVDEILKDFDKEILNEKTFDFIYSKITMPSIFMKPDNYFEENEVRMAFEMRKDTKIPRDLHNRGLLDYIEIVKR